MKTDTVNKNKIENNMNENDEYLYIKSINKDNAPKESINVYNSDL